MDFQENFYEDEVRNGFYVPSIMKRNWASGLEVLGEIDKICKKYNLQWFMCFGTLLGAVRHKGFIPWDDDLDIMMKRKDFNELKKHADEFPENYVFATVQDMDEYNSLMMSVNNDSSALVAPGQLKKNHGFPYNTGVDIYMLDPVSDDPNQEKKRMDYIHGLMWLCQSLELESEEEVNVDKEGILREFENRFDVKFNYNESLLHQIYREIDTASSRFCEEDTEKLVYMYPHMYAGKHVYDSDVFKSTVDLMFEGHILWASPQYDKLLRIFYDDQYMEIQKGYSRHDYPVYSKWEKKINELGTEIPYIYKYAPKALFHEKSERSDIREKNAAILTKLSELCILAKKVVEADQYAMVPGIMNLCQTTAVKLGENLEKRMISPEIVVGRLEGLCEVAYQVYIGAGNPDKNKKMKAELCEKIHEMEKRIKEVYEGLDKAKEKTEIVMLPFKALAWDTMKPYYDKYKDDPTVNLYVVPIPYYLRCRDTSLGSEIYEGEALAEMVPVEDYRTFPFEDMKPHIIVIQNPYDGYSMGSEVNRYFFSENLKRLCDKLVYIPWFVTDDIDIDDERCSLDVANMRHYVTVPGCVSADLILLPTENLRKSYIRVLTEFCGEDTKERWERCVKVMTPFLS